MNENASCKPAAEDCLDRWALMEKGRKLHDRAVFEILARGFARLGLTRRGRGRQRRPPAFTPSPATPLAR